MRVLSSLLLSALLALPGLASGAAVITIVNGNAAGVGFNDPTPVAPLPTNPGTTLGEQRLIAFQYAAQLWGNTLDSIPAIRVLATFEPLTCTPTAAVLGSAGPITVSSDFPGAIYANTWYHAALANKLAGGTLDPANAEIRARFNVNLGLPGCLTGSLWYLGRDLAAPPGLINLVTVLLHEFGHGLGFSSVTNVSTGVPLAGQSDAYSRFYFDTGLNLARDQMTDAQRQQSAISGKVVWTGTNVTTAVPDVLDLGTPLLRVTAPVSIAGNYAVGPASFGPQLASPGITGDVVAALDAADAAGPSTFDACSPISNAAAVAGKIALVDRGTCGFIVKVKNAQNAGAIAVLVADNAPGSPPAGLGGADPTITISSVRITQPDGTAIRTALGSGTVTVTLGVDLAVYAGADASGRALLNSPNPVQPGSSISHWAPIAFPNQLMEPAINTDLTHSLKPPLDLTLPLMRDIGWYADADLDLVPDASDQCIPSDLAPTVVIGTIDTGIPNTFFTNGCSIKDLVNNCAAGAKNHGGFVSCVTQLGNDLVKASILTGSQKGTLTSAAARSK